MASNTFSYLEDLPVGYLEPIERMKRDVAEAAVTLSKDEVRFLVEAYYDMQDRRKRSDQQTNALAQAGEPHRVLAWLAGQDGNIERQVQRALDHYSAGQELGRWARSQVGIGPVITAGLLAHIDFDRVRTFGQIWRFAGLDPTQKWIGRAGAQAVIAQHAPKQGPVDAEAIQAIGAAINTAPIRIIEGVTNFASYKGKKTDGWIKGHRMTWENVTMYLVDQLGDDDATALTELVGGNPDEELSPAHFDIIAGEMQLETADLVGDIREYLDGQGGVGDFVDVAIPRAELTAYLAKRPWNAALKTLCWKIGDSFVKFSNHKNSFYGPVYRARKALEEERNAAGLFAEQAAETLATRQISDAATLATYRAGRLPAGRLDLRARRVAVKLFLSHFFEVGYRIHHNAEPPVPFAIARLGHSDYIPPPNWPMIES